MVSDQNSSDPAPECQTMASDQLSSDPAPKCQNMALNHDSLSPAIQRQEKELKIYSFRNHKWYQSHVALDLGLRGVVGVEFIKKRSFMTLKKCSVTKRYGMKEHFILPIQVSTARVDVSTTKRDGVDSGFAEYRDKQVKSESVDVVSTISSSAVKTVESKVESVDVKNKGVCSTIETQPIKKNNFSPSIIEDWNSNDESVKIKTAQAKEIVDSKKSQEVKKKEKDPEDSLIMGDDDLSTIPEKETYEVIKYSIEDLVLILCESDDTFENDSECDLPSCDDFSPVNIPEGRFVTFSNPIFDSNNDFTSSDDESLFDEDVPKDNVKIYSKPLFEFDNEYISSDVNPLFDEVLKNIENKDCYLDEPDLLVTPLSDANEGECLDPGGDVEEIELLLHHDPSTLKMSVASILEGFTNESPLEENDDLFNLGVV
nr:hypothetical protein [Tanacetum cinerariifolium]